MASPLFFSTPSIFRYPSLLPITPIRTIQPRRQFRLCHGDETFNTAGGRWRRCRAYREENSSTGGSIRSFGGLNRETSNDSVNEGGRDGFDGKGGDTSGGNGNWERGFDGEDEGGMQVPEEISWGLRSGVLQESVLMRWKEIVRGGGIMALLMKWSAFRRRMLADERFFFKLMAQILIGDGTSLIGEIQVRGSDIVDEAEYVAADMIVGTVVEAAFVWILAPMIQKGPGKVGASGMTNFFARERIAIGRFLNALPANIFEAASTGRSFSLGQRIAAFFYAGAQYAAIGIGAGIVGMAITLALIEGRKIIDKTYVPQRPIPDLWGSSFGWGAFMALSSNTRFQLVEGIEMLLAKMMAGRADLGLKAAILALRFGNNYWGGVQFVQFFRFLGLHATAESAH